MFQFRELIAPAVAGIGLLSATPPATAAVIADWSFGNDVGAIKSDPQGASSAALAPALGAGTAEGHHADPSADWRAAPGPVGGIALASDGWRVGDYYQFSINPSGDTNLTLSFDQKSSRGGPAEFFIETTTDGSKWTVLPDSSYVLAAGRWNASGLYDLPANTVGVRLVDASLRSTQGGLVRLAGYDRIDDVVISGTAKPIPEPASVGILGLAALGLMSWRSWMKEGSASFLKKEAKNFSYLSKNKS